MTMKAIAAEQSACPMNYPGFVFRTLRRNGYRVDAILAGTGLSAESFEDPDTAIEYATLQRFLLNAVEHTGDPHLGCRLARRFDAQYIGLPAYAAMSAARFEDALRVLSRYFSLTFTAIDFVFPDVEADRAPGEAAIRLRSKFPFQDVEYFVSSSALVGCTELFKAMLRAERVVSRAETTASEPAGWADVAEEIGFPVRFDCEEDRLFIHETLLNQPLPGADPISHPQLLALCDQFSARTDPEASPASEVLEFLERGDNLHASLSQAAAALGYSERGLRRRLEGAGTSFRKLSEHVRARRARELLTRTAQPIHVIAQGLGYDSASNFARGFKRWTGLSPSAFRDGHAPNGDDGRK